MKIVKLGFLGVLKRKNINLKVKIVFIFCFLTFYSCAGLNSALSNYHANNGGKCAVNTVYYYVYNPDTDKYLESKYLSVTEDGKDIASKEYSWITKVANYYLSKNQYSTYYKTSPYSDGRYRFIVECSRWH